MDAMLWRNKLAALQVKHDIKGARLALRLLNKRLSTIYHAAAQ